MIDLDLASLETDGYVKTHIITIDNCESESQTLEDTMTKLMPQRF